MMVALHSFFRLCRTTGSVEKVLLAIDRGENQLYSMLQNQPFKLIVFAPVPAYRFSRSILRLGGRLFLLSPNNLKTFIRWRFLKDMTDQHRWSDERLENFLQEIILEHPSEAVAEMVYCPTVEAYGAALRRHQPDYYQNEQVVVQQWEKTRAKKTVATTVSDPYRLGLHTPSLIIVYPLIKEYSPEECISLLKDHEYVHVQDWFDG